MAYPVKGKDVVFEVYDDDAADYLPHTCWESGSFNITPELIEKTTVSSGAGYDWHERRRGWGYTASGVTDIFSDGVTVFDMLDPVNINKTYLIRISFEDSLGNTAVITGSAKLDASGVSASNTDFSDWELALIGVGMYELVQTIDGTPGGGGGSGFGFLLEVGGEQILQETGDEILLENG